MKNGIIFLEQVLKETIWGGTRLGDFGCDVSGKTVGESWCVCAHPHGDNIVLGQKKKLSEFYKSNPEFFGNIDSKEFPLLTKIIDAKTDLSIQVHPDDEYAFKNENGSIGKTECWYVLDAEPETQIVIGHNAESKDVLASMIHEEKWSELIREVPVKKGDFFFIESGTVHAIKGGTLIFETQQPCDITYRVYDYDRLSDGKKRPLHIKQCLDVIKVPFEKKEPPLNPSKTSNKNLVQKVSCPFFTVWTLDVNGEQTVVQDQKFMIATVVEGEGSVDSFSIKKGMSFIIPFEYGRIIFNGNMQLVISAV
ncbi:MAG: class I mannose-6-phosphate isomerase [Treponema sp.]|nr:class I mannose-6-phosphate isomerase [Treponema sp.]